jgi:hypothetical protein
MQIEKTQGDTANKASSAQPGHTVWCWSLGFWTVSQLGHWMRALPDGKDNKLLQNPQNNTVGLPLPLALLALLLLLLLLPLLLLLLLPLRDGFAPALVDVAMEGAET